MARQRAWSKTKRGALLGIAESLGKSRTSVRAACLMRRLQQGASKTVAALTSQNLPRMGLRKGDMCTQELMCTYACTTPPHPRPHQNDAVMGPRN